MVRAAKSLVVMSVLVIGIAGCGGGGSKIRLVSVSGKVTYDGKPLDKGQLSFITTTAAKSQRAYGCEVKGGVYSVKVEPGDMTVQVLAMRDVPDKFVVAADGTKKPEQENYIPAKYSAASELKYKVPDNGASDANFDLKP